MFDMLEVFSEDISSLIFSHSIGLQEPFLPQKSVMHYHFEEVEFFII